MGSNESRVEYENRNNHESQDGSQLKPLVKIFNIEKLTGERKKILCIYSFAITRARAAETAELSGFPVGNEQTAPGTTSEPNTDDEDNKVAWRIKELVLDKALGEWLESRKIKDRLYLIDQRVSRLYTQFVIERPEFVEGSDPECCMERQITLQVPRLVGSKYVPVDEKYDIAIKKVCKRNCNPRNMDLTLKRAINFLLLADVNRDSSFTVKLSQGNIGRLYNLADESHPRVAKLDPCLRCCRGLATIILSGRPRAPVGGGGVYLRLFEELSYFFSPVNMIQLIRDHFNFNVDAPLEHNQIVVLEQALINVAIRFCPGDLSDGDKSLPEVHVPSISGVSQRPICDELSSYVDEQAGQFAGQITVKEQFECEFPDVKLKYIHLPCLISIKGRQMPMEMCWIKPGELLRHKSPSQEEMFDPDQLHRRTEIFEENCTEFTQRRMSTFEKFGFQLKPDLI